MGHQAISELIVVVIFLLLIIPAMAFSGNSSSLSRENVTTTETIPYTIKLFIPTTHMIHSDQITDLINGHNGDVIIATSFGISTYNGSWSTRHLNLDNISLGLMDDYVTAVEYDHDGNLWIGYSGGLQIYNGRYYRTIRDQQLLKETRILDLQRWNDEMWIATGHAGIHRYRNETWTWFQPGVKNGSGFYEVDSMALDPAGNMLVIATPEEGLWIVRPENDTVQFVLLAGKSETFGLLKHVKRDPHGGVYFFNESTIVHFDETSGFQPILAVGDLTLAQNTVNDLAADPFGSLYIATDTGIYIWRDGAVFRHLTRFEGIGTSNIVDTINVDAQDRVWFSTQDDVGYYLDAAMQDPRIVIERMTIAPAESPVPVELSSSVPSPVRGQMTSSQVPAPAVTAHPAPGPLSGIIDPILRAIDSITSRFGLSIVH